MIEILLYLSVMGLFHLIVLKYIEVLKRNNNAVVLLSLYCQLLIYIYIYMKKHFMHLEKSVEE